MLSILTLVSLLFCLAVLAVAVRSYWIGDRIDYRKLRPAGEEVRVTEWQLAAGDGCVMLSYLRYGWASSDAGYSAWLPRPREDREWSTSKPEDPSESLPSSGRFSAAGLRCNGDGPADRGGSCSVVIALPLWFIVLALAASPALRLRRFRRSIRPGDCAICGYDMRATPTSTTALLALW